MDIKVKYTGCTDAQVAYSGGAVDPRGILEEGKSYVLRGMRQDASHTWYFLVGFKESFNSVCFEEGE